MKQINLKKKRNKENKTNWTRYWKKMMSSQNRNNKLKKHPQEEMIPQINPEVEVSIELELTGSRK